MALNVSARSRFAMPTTPALIRTAGVCAAVGIGLSITDYGELGKWLTVIGVVLLIASLHRYGRSGPDAAIVFELAPARKKKRKKRRPTEETADPAADAAATDDAER